MKRRDFIKAVAGSAAAWPLATHAQPAAAPVIGYLQSALPNYYAQFTSAVAEGLKGDRLYRRSERGHRISVGGGSL
jgi:hypothetical protein